MADRPQNPSEPNPSGTAASHPERELAQSNAMLLELAFDLGKERDLRRAFKRLLETTVSWADMQCGAAYDFVAAGDSLSPEVVAALRHESCPALSWLVQQPSILEPLRAGELVYLDDQQLQPVPCEEGSARQAVIIPVLDGTELVSAILLSSHRADSMPASVRYLFRSLGMQVGAVLARLRAETELRNSEERYRSFIAQSQDGLWRMEFPAPVPLDLPRPELIARIMDNTIAECNEAMARMYGLPSAEALIGRSLSDFISPEGAQEVISAFIDCDYNLMDVETEELDDEGQPHVFLNSSLGIVEDGMLLRCWGIQRDITERKQIEDHRRELEARMLKMQKLESLGVLAGGIAHDFNNLLVGILGNADFGLTETESGSPMADLLTDVRSSAQRASELVQQMLAYAGKGQLRTEVFSPVDVVGEMPQLLRASISKRARLTLALAATPPIHGDVTQIRQVVMNLITNASDAIAQGASDGMITVQTGAEHCEGDTLRQDFLDDELPSGQYAFLRVTDTGVGMDDRTRAQLFNPFFSTKPTGRGLGLAAVLGIVRAHGGAILMDSSPGAGSTFTVYLPVYHEPPADQAPNGKDTPREDFRGCSVLIADDEAPVRKVLERMLRRMGFEVTITENGDEALAAFRAPDATFDCVFIDYTMPGTDGIECIRQMRELSPEIPLILSSGYQHLTDDDADGMDLPTAFVPKPYSYGSLLRLLGKVLSKTD